MERSVLFFGTREVIVATIGQTLKNMIETMGISQASLAGKLGVAPPTVNRYWDSDNLTYQTIVKICDACGVDAWKVLASVETELPMTFFEAMDALSQLTEEQQKFISSRLAADVEFVTTFTGLKKP